MPCEFCGAVKSEKLMANKPNVKIPFNCETCGAIKFNYQPLRDIVMVFPDPLPDKLGSIYIPEKNKEKHGNEWGYIIAKGEGYYDKDGKFIKVDLLIGDRVAYDKNVPWTMTVQASDGVNYVVKYMGSMDVLATE